MAWILDACEVGAGSGNWHWCAAAPLSDGALSWRRWTRNWRGAGTYASRGEALEAGRYAIGRIRTPSVPDGSCSETQERAPVEILQPMIDSYTLDTIDGELALVAPALMLAEPGTRWAGCAVYGRDYLLSLVECGLESGVIAASDLPQRSARRAA